MKFDKQIFRKVLWAPAAVLSVSMTLYLSNLWLSQKSSETILNSTVPEIQNEVQKDESSPEDASEDGQDKKTEDAGSPNSQQGEQEESENSQQAQSTPPASVPPLPQPQPEPTPTPTESKEDTASSSSKEDSSTNKNKGNMDLEKYIAAKIKDINKNGKYWNSRYKDQLLESWKLTLTVESLLNAIERLSKEQLKSE